MKTCTLTFHASHNFGSALQAYALQQTLLKLFGHNEIIDFRSKQQQRMMRPITFRPRLNCILKDITHLLYLYPYYRRHLLFEKFINNNLTLSKRYSSEKELINIESIYDLFIAGGDQIWNPYPEDFSIAYLLPFIKTKKKISYAVSLGPKGNLKGKEHLYISTIPQFNNISVREIGSCNSIQHFYPKNIHINCDPVFLISKERWVSIINTKPIIHGEYIFFYTLFADKEMVEMVKQISKILNKKVVIPNFTNFYDFTSPFQKKIACGPLEFLNLLYYSSFICTSSFHGTAFSILLNKNFICLRGNQDNRISDLLSLTNLSNRSISKLNDVNNHDFFSQIDFSYANEVIKKEKKDGLNYIIANGNL